MERTKGDAGRLCREAATTSGVLLRASTGRRRSASLKVALAASPTLNWSPAFVQVRLRTSQSSQRARPTLHRASPCPLASQPSPPCACGSGRTRASTQRGSPPAAAPSAER